MAERNRSFHVGGGESVPVGPGPSSTFDASRLDFGHHAGRTIAELAAAVRDLGEKGASDGLEADARGNVYGGDYEHNALRRLAPGGTWQTIAQGPELLWPDTLSVGPDGYLYVIANQLHRQANFNGGRDLRVKPYRLLRVKIDAAPAPTR